MHTDLTTGSIHTHLISTQALAALSLTALVGNALGEKNTKEAQHITLKRYRYRDYCC